MGDHSRSSNSCNFSINIIINRQYDYGSTKEDLSLEKRVSLTPDTAKSIIGLGLKIYIEKNYATHIGIPDEEFKRVGVEIKNSSIEVLSSIVKSSLVKLICPSSDEIKNIKEKSFILGMLNPSQNKTKINEMLKKIKFIFFRASSRTTRANQWMFSLHSLIQLVIEL